MLRMHCRYKSFTRIEYVPRPGRLNSLDYRPGKPSYSLSRSHAIPLALLVPRLSVMSTEETQSVAGEENPFSFKNFLKRTGEGGKREEKQKGKNGGRREGEGVKSTKSKPVDGQEEGLPFPELGGGSEEPDGISRGVCSHMICTDLRGGGSKSDNQIPNQVLI